MPFILPTTLKLLAILTPDERQQFLPEPLWSELNALYPAAILCDPETLDPAQFARVLKEINPQVVLAAWKAPALPVDLPPGLAYFCYLCGSVKRCVSREHLSAGLVVTNWGSSISRTVAEWALFHAIGGLRGLPHWFRSMHVDGGWKCNDVPTGSLFGRRVGLHGFGAVARALVALLRPFDVKIEVWAPDVDAQVESAWEIKRAPSLEALFSTSEVLFEVAPLNSATEGVVTESLLRLIPPGGLFVNVGRGKVVDEEALIRVAREGQIRVGLDVFSVEPLPPDSPLRSMPNVTLSPHIAGPTLDRRRDAGAHVLRNLRAFRESRDLEGLVTPSVYDLST